MRPVRYRASFKTDLAAQESWLRRHRAPLEGERLREALTRFAHLLATMPGLGEPFETHGTIVRRISPLTTRLPYLVMYSYDTATESAPVWLELLVHEAQDRERFDPDPWD